MRSAFTRLVPPLVDIFRLYDFTPHGIRSRLGNEATDAWHRGEPGALRSVLGKETDPLALLIHIFILFDAYPASTFVSLLGSHWLRDAEETRCVLRVDTPPLSDPLFRMDMDIYPHVINGRECWVLSDKDASLTMHTPSPDHVLGVGAASLSLMRTVPTTPVDRVLDVGTGSAVQIIPQLQCAHQIVGTDIHERALHCAEATLSQFPECSPCFSEMRDDGAPLVELRQGSWFDPVKGELFDRIIANPPFVIGPPEVHHVYRDSGLHLDGATELVVRNAARHLKFGGTAHILGAWVHEENQSWAERVAHWLPQNGYSVWCIQRDVSDVYRYVATWLRDASIDVRSTEASRQTMSWLRYFSEHSVKNIGFGFVFIRKIDDEIPTEILAENLFHPFDDPLSTEVEEFFLRTQWLREHTAILDEHYGLRPSCILETVHSVDTISGMGFTPTTVRITRTDGPRWSHEIDAPLAAILSGLHPHGLSFRDVVELYALAHSDIITHPDELLKESSAILADFILHGIVLPSDF